MSQGAGVSSKDSNANVGTSSVQKPSWFLVQVWSPSRLLLVYGPACGLCGHTVISDLERQGSTLFVLFVHSLFFGKDLKKNVDFFSFMQFFDDVHVQA